MDTSVVGLKMQKSLMLFALVILLSPQLMATKTPRMPTEYLKETKGAQRILVVGGGRIYKHQYPDNAFLANIDCVHAEADRPCIDISNPDSVPQKLHNKFDVVVWENVDSPLFFNKETFESIESLLKRGGILVANDPLFFLDRKNMSLKAQARYEEFHPHLWKLPEGSSFPHNILYEDPPYKGADDPKLNTDAFAYRLKPWIESRGMKQVTLEKSTDYWYAQPKEYYIVAHFD